MSLIRIALRIAIVEALRGQTLVGDNVLDSQIGALDVAADGSLRTDQQKAWIAVYTDASTSKDGAADMSLRALAPNGATQILIETGLTAAQVLIDPQTEQSVVYPGIPDTDAAFELHSDIVMRQVADVLTDPGNEWAEIARRFILSFRSVERSRVSGDQQGTRLAAQQMRIVADLVSDPVRGMPLKDGSPLKAFFDLAEADCIVPDPAHPDPLEAPMVADPVVASTVALMRAQIDATPQPFDWQAVQRRFGFYRAEADALLITPPAGVPGDTAVAIKDQPSAEVNTPSIIWQPNDRSPL